MAVNFSIEALPAAEQAELPVYRRLFARDFISLPRSAIKSSGYVVDTLEAAIWVAGNAPDFKNGMMTAVSLGEDTDTVATITASLLAAAGQDAVPKVGGKQLRIVILLVSTCFLLRRDSREKVDYKGDCEVSSGRNPLD